MNLIEQLMRDEGVRAPLYDDANGKPITRGCTVIGWPTIGVGRNLVANPLSMDEVQLLLANDIARVRRALANYPWFTALASDEVRQSVFVNMGFNLGVGGLLKLSGLIEAVEARDWQKCSDLMLGYLWAKQVGARAKRLAQQLVTGTWV